MSKRIEVPTICTNCTDNNYCANCWKNEPPPIEIPIAKQLERLLEQERANKAYELLKNAGLGDYFNDKY